MGSAAPAWPGDSAAHPGALENLQAGPASSDLFEQEQTQLNPTEANSYELWLGQLCKFSTGQKCRGGLPGCPEEVTLLE